MKKYKPLDSQGKRIRLGQIIRILSVPPMSPSSRKKFPDTFAAFRHVVGKYQVVRGFDKFGHVELSFRIRKGKYRGFHWLWIEPHLVRVRKSRLSKM